MTHEPERKDCLEPEAVAAFAEGRLDERRRAAVVAHLDGCEDCMTEVALAIRAHQRENVAPARMRRVRFAGALAAGVVLAVAGAALLWQRAQGADIARLAQLAPRSARIVEPRLTGGFAWAAYRGSGRAAAEPVDAERLKLAGAAGEVIEQAARDRRAEAQHAAGIALVLVEQPVAAIERLERVTEASNDAKAWSDLAAARYVAATELQRPSLYPSALAAADRALQGEPALAEALFNRALILERMRLADAARRAWTRYLEADPSSPWADEARARLAERPAPSSRLERNRRQLELVASRGDAAAAGELAAAMPEHARTFAETEFLGRWGEAAARGDAAEADRLLSVSRAIGDALARSAGESFLRETVAAIDRAAPDDRRAMAYAHALYRAARLAWSRYEIVAARRDLERAKESFARAGSPMALPAAYYAAAARLASNEVRDARVELEALGSSIDPRFIALGAQVRWELGRAYQLEDDPRAAIAAFTEGAAMFQRLGEHTRQATMETLLATALDSVGRGDDGWSARVRAFEALSAEGDPNLMMASLGAARRAELLAGRRDAALALARLETPDWRADARPIDVVDSLVQRAVLAAAQGEDADAAESARAAVRAAAAFSDPVARQRLEADAAVADGAARLRREPRAAIASLTRAVDVYRAHDLARPLPEPLLLRSRALRAIGDDAGAERDLEEGMRAVERNQERQGGGVLDAGSAVFDEALGMALDRGDVPAAFAIAERARGGRATLASLQQQLAGTATVVLGITALPGEIVTFAVRGHDAIVARRARERRALAALAQAALAENDAAAALYDDVVRPVEPLLGDARAAVVVPDRTLAAVPFAALYDRERRRYLIERFPLAMAPSASALERIPPLRAESVAALALPSGAATQTKALPSTDEEVREIVPLYRRAKALPYDATPLAALSGAEADVLHIAGHTASEAGGGEQSFVLAKGERVSWRTIAAAPPPRASVIVLAACETLRPPPSAATLAPSLGAALVRAGAADVVGTLAAIPDRDARMLFRRIHRELAAGAGAAEAVRAAQLEAIRTGGMPSWRLVAVLTRRI
ncbi:MAG TPA: CHAT domain-containing protein [Thermoanaerobaculia bacterium]|nr:CHAT domain-containing protein [Thermoanaerobaculia bacterium]